MQHKEPQLRRVSSSSSTMLSSSSSTPSHPFPHSFSHQTITPPPSYKSMEHVWKHINHAPLLCNPLATALSSSFSHHSHTQLHLVQPHQHHHKPPSNVEALISNTNPFQNMAFSSDSLSTLGRKRFLDSDSKFGDRRKKRMMKNREAAARSRARKQVNIHCFLTNFHHFKCEKFLYAYGGRYFSCSHPFVVIFVLLTITLLFLFTFTVNG